MADVFVSYASPDREKAKLLADIIAARGHSVWWDRTIPPGRMFDEVIQEALHAAKCVVVLWSKVSVASNWVKTEAAEAASRGVLVPAVIENVVLPLEFKRIQAAGLAGWNGDPNHPELKSLLNAIERVMRGDSSGLGVRPLTAGDAEAGGRRAAMRSESESPPRARPKLGMVGVVAGLVVLTAAGYLMLKQSAQPERQTIPAAESRSADSREAPADPATRTIPKQTPSSQAAERSPAAAIKAQRINLLAPENGGQLVAASNDSWRSTINGKENSYVYVDNGEGVYAFNNEQPAVFDTFKVLIPESNEFNLNEFELLAANDSPTGRFESIGRFKTQNVKLFKSPYQEFQFPPVRARYLKVKPLTNHRGDKGGVTIAYQFQLFGVHE